MLELNRSTIIETHLQEVASTVNSLAEGTAMVHVLEGGKGVVKPSAGTSGELFAGVSHSKFLRPTTAMMVELLTVSNASKVTLARTPVGAAADRGVFNAAGAALTSGTVDGNTKYSLSGKEITVHADLNGTVIKVQYAYELTANEAALLYGSDLAILDVSAAKNVGLITTGVIFTDQYDPAVNWAGTTGISPAVKTGAGGKFTIGGNGFATDAVVVSVPTANDPWLGLRLHP